MHKNCNKYNCIMHKRQQLLNKCTMACYCDCELCMCFNWLLAQGWADTGCPPWPFPPQTKQRPFYFKVLLKMLFLENYAQNYLKMPLCSLKKAHAFSFEKCCFHQKKHLKMLFVSPDWNEQVYICGDVWTCLTGLDVRGFYETNVTSQTSVTFYSLMLKWSGDVANVILWNM